MEESGGRTAAGRRALGGRPLDGGERWEDRCMEGGERWRTAGGRGAVGGPLEGGGGERWREPLTM